MDRPQVKKQIAQDAIEVKAMTPAELTAFAQSEIDRWTPLIEKMMATKGP
jgi:tripartite-type tricarboxylate transporter receptor subunit TctC